MCDLDPLSGVFPTFCRHKVGGKRRASDSQHILLCEWDAVLGRCVSRAGAADMARTQNQNMVDWLLDTGFCRGCRTVFLALCETTVSPRLYRGVGEARRGLQLFPGSSRRSTGMGDGAG